METILYVAVAWLLGITVGYAIKSKPKVNLAELSVPSAETMISIGEVEETWAQLAEHLSDRFDPDEAVNKATDLLSRLYLQAE